MSTITKEVNPERKGGSCAKMRTREISSKLKKLNSQVVNCELEALRNLVEARKCCQNAIDLLNDLIVSQEALRMFKDSSKKLGSLGESCQTKPLKS